MTMVADASSIKKLKSMVASKDAQVEALNGRIAVSYTHLTLPTIYSV